MNLINNNLSGLNSASASFLYGNGSNITGLPTSATPSLSSVLAVGNTTGANNISMDTGQSIISGNGGGQIDLDAFGTPGAVQISSDSGVGAESSLYVDNTTASLCGNTNASLYSNDAVVLETFNSPTHIYLNGVAGSGDGKIYIRTQTEKIIIGGDASQPQPANIAILNNGTQSAYTNILGGGFNSLFLNSQSSTMNAGVKNSVIIGGSGLTATASNNVYVPSIRIASKLYMPTGTNKNVGTATFSSGAVTITTNAVTTKSMIMLSIQGGTLTNVGSPYISARTVGTSFVISSTNILDTSTVAWVIIEQY